MSPRPRPALFLLLLVAFGTLSAGALLGCGLPAEAQSSVVSVNGVKAQKPDLPLTHTRILGTTPGQCLAVQADGTVGGTACGISCPSAALPDFGVCANAATSVRQINFADGNFTTAAVLHPQAGQVLHFGVGTYTLPQISVADSTAAPLLRSNVITGEGTAHTILQQNSTATGPVLTNANFATLTGSNSIYGAGYLLLRDFTVNAGAASADCTVKLYGTGMVMRYVTIQHGGTCNRYTEWAYDLRAYPPFTFNISATFDHVIEFDAKTNGVEYNGPLDADEISGQSYKNGGWAFYLQQALHATYIQAIESDNARPGSTGAIYVNGTTRPGAIPAGLTGSDVYADGYSGTMIYYGPRSAPLKLDHSNIAAGGANGLVSNGLVIDGGFGNSYNGEIESTTGTAVRINGGNLTGSFYMAGNTGYWFDFASEPIPSNFSAIGGDALGTAFLHVPGAVDTLALVNLPAYGPKGDRTYLSTPGLYTRLQGKRFAYSPSGDTVATVDTSSGAVLPLDSATGQRKLSLRRNGVAKYEIGIQDDGSFYVYDAARGSNLLSVSADGGVNLGEGASSVFVQQNGSVLLRNGLTVPALKSNTGTRYLCIDTNGRIGSSATPCAGT